MAGAQVRVKGYRECTRAARKAGKAVNKEVRAAFREVAEPVRTEAASRFSAVDARSAAGFKIRVQAKGIAVEQSIGKTTGRRGDYGALQMRRGLLPALESNEDNIVEGFEKAVDKVADIFERGG